MLEVRLCGGVEIRRDGAAAPQADFAGRQGRLVFAYLVCERNRSVPREELADLLWPDELPSSWANSLSVVISRLRRLLSDAGVDGDLRLTSPAGTYRLEIDESVTVDWERALRDVAAAEEAVAAGDADEALSRAGRAAAILAPGFLVDDCVWVDAQRELGRDLLVRAAIARSEAHLRQGNAVRAVDAARDALARDDTREAAFRTLMRAHAAAGERAEALRAWERCRTTLVEELGVDPSPETEAVYLEILGGPRETPAPGSEAALPSGVVTFLLTDIVESSALWEQVPASMAAALERHDALVSEVVAQNGGALLKSKLEGDATVSVFARASAGALAAFALRDALVAQDWPEGAVPQVRMALHTGEAYERDGDYFGPALNRAARLRALAGAGQILLSQAAAELVRDQLPDEMVLLDRGHRDLRGLSRGENVYELAARSSLETADYERADLVRPPLPSALTGVGPFVGRGGELATLRKDWETVLGGAARGVLIGGEPGVGKSRLAAEYARETHAAGAFVLYGRCDEELGAPYQPFIDAVRALAPALGSRRLREVRGVEELIRVVPELADLVPATAPTTRADPDTERYALFGAVTQLLVTASEQAPVVLVLDDLHWAGKTTLTLLRHILRGAGPARLLVMGTYRDTELSRTHPLAATMADLRSDGVATRLPVGGLFLDDVVAYLAAVGNNDSALGRELARVTSGNPFFLIEALRHVAESGGIWQPDSLPEGVREATGRRLSRLSDSTSAALSVAAVVGSTFALDIVEAVRGQDLVDEFDEARRAGLVVEESGAPGVFRFAHAIVRQVLLAELVTVRRVRTHRLIAELLEERAAAAPGAYLTDLAHHWFECASTGAADQAVAACTRAAEHAIAGLAYEEAGDLYGMALAASESIERPDPGTVAALHLARCNVFLTAGEVVGARAAIDDLSAVAGRDARLSAWHRTFAGQLAVLTEPERLVEVVDGVDAAAQVMRDVGDVAGEAKARYVYALAAQRLGRIGDAERALDAALSASRAAGDRSLADAVLAEVPPTVLWGPSPITRASGRCLDVVRVCRITAGASAVESVALRCQAVLEALRGRSDAARRMIGSARRTAERLGLADKRLETDVTSGMVELLAGDGPRAEVVLRPAWEELRERRFSGEAARAGGLLARALLLQDRVDEAEVVGDEAAQLAGVDLRAGITWRGVLAEVAARRGDHERALSLARAAVDMASGTDALLSLADAQLSLASVLRRAGRDAEASAEARVAVEVCDAKGATVLADAARVEAHMGSGGLSESVGAQTAADKPYENPAARYAAFAVEAMNSHDPLAVAAYIVPDIEIEDRRKVGEGTVSGERLVELLSAGGGAVTSRTVATRGDWLVITCFGWSRDGAERELLAVARCQPDGHFDRQTWFDADDVASAFDELDAWYVEGEGAPHAGILEQLRHYIAMVNRGDWSAAREYLSDGYELHDHRSAGLPMMTVAQLGKNFDALRTTGRMRVMRVEHILDVSDTALLIATVEEGEVTRDGGRFEHRMLNVLQHDGRLITAQHMYDLDDHGAAQVRFEAPVLRRDPLANLVIDSVDAFVAAWGRGDWEGVEQAFGGSGANTSISDDRPLARVGDVDALEQLRFLWETTKTRISRGVFLTRGDRLAMYRMTYHVQTGHSGESDIDVIGLVQFDDDLSVIPGAMFDGAEFDRAYAELDRRYLGALGAASGAVFSHLLDSVDAVNAANLAAIEASMADDFFFTQQRMPIGDGEAREVWLNIWREIVANAPDARMTLPHVLAVDGVRALVVWQMTGTYRGVVYERSGVGIFEMNDAGQLRGVDNYELDQLEDARAAFAAPPPPA